MWSEKYIHKNNFSEGRILSNVDIIDHMCIFLGSLLYVKISVTHDNCWEFFFCAYNEIIYKRSKLRFIATDGTFSGKMQNFISSKIKG